MKFAYYPGCTGHGTSVEYDRSTRAVCAALGLELEEILDWSCCGSSPGQHMDAALSAALSARNLQVARRMNCEGGVTTPCPSCLSNLKLARARIEDKSFADRVNALLDTCCENLPQSRSVLQILYEDCGTDAIAHKVTRPLTGLRIAPYYGCLLNRPAELMQFDAPENPISMDRILEALGAIVVDFPLKTECCGASQGIPRQEITRRLSGKLLAQAQASGADAVAVACPLCHMNLDLRQAQAGAEWHRQFNMPVFYYTQLMALAFGLPHDVLGLEKLCVNPATALLKLPKHGKEETGTEQPIKEPHL